MNSSQGNFYRDQAHRTHKEAEAAVLVNVRDNLLRSWKVWNSLAERAERVDQERRVREEAIEDRRNAEASLVGCAG